MSSSFGESFRVTIFGQSHSEGIGVVIDGLPAGFKPDFEALRAFMRRRSPGFSPLNSARRESDEIEVLSGLYEGRLCGSPLCCVIRNTDFRSQDYDAIRDTPRPGHADFTAFVRYSGYNDPRGGGHLSGRLTAPVCLAGGLAMQLLEKKGARVAAHVARIGSARDRLFDPVNPEIGDLSDSPMRVLDASAGAAMASAIEEARADRDSLSGEIECAVTGLPAGIGDPIFDGIENVVSRAVFAIPGVKGVWFGRAKTLGSANNDAFRIDNGKAVCETNNCGGILGGITNGMPVIFTASLKPTPSIAREQQTINMREMKNASVTVSGRHDPCIAPRAVAAVEAAAALAVCDAWMRRSVDKWI